MSAHINPQTAEETIAADVIEVFLGIHDHDLIFGTNCKCISVNRLGRHPVPACIDDQRSRFAGHETGIDTPRTNISESGYCEAVR